MPFGRRNSFRLHPVNTLKHVVDQQLSIEAGTETDVLLAAGSENAASTNAPQCDIGAHVRTIFLNVQVVPTTDATGLINNAYMYVFGNPGNNIPSTEFPPVNEVGTSDARKQIFHQKMAMLSDSNDSIPIALFKGVLKIPRKFSRMGVNDQISVRIGTPTGGAVINACVQCIYKEVR